VPTAAADCLVLFFLRYYYDFEWEALVLVVVLGRLTFQQARE
jgi:hypothetical protein